MAIRYIENQKPTLSLRGVVSELSPEAQAELAKAAIMTTFYIASYLGNWFADRVADTVSKKLTKY